MQMCIIHKIHVYINYNVIIKNATAVTVLLLLMAILKMS